MRPLPPDCVIRKSVSAAAFWLSDQPPVDIYCPEDLLSGSEQSEAAE
jgi:hypothetical protein